MENGKIKNFLTITIIVIVLVAGTIFAKNRYGVAKNNDVSLNQTKDQPTNSNGSVAGTSTDQDNISANIQQKDTDIILFYGDTCPHCKIVEDYISKNNITRYIKFQNLEVYSNKNNAKTMLEKQDLCKDLSADDKGGVPFLYSSEKCVVGDQPVIDYLKQVSGI